MLDDLAMFLGGRVAEEIAIGDVTTGASNDIERATKIAKQMVTRYGMSEKLGPQTFGEAQPRGLPRPRLLGERGLLARRSPTRSTRRSAASSTTRTRRRATILDRAPRRSST